MDDEDTWLGPAPRPDTEVGIASVMLADTDEWEHTDRAIEAQGTLDTSPQMYEDTGVVIIDTPAELPPPAQSDRLVVTFRKPSAFRAPAPAPRAATADDWPPAPREPARVSPQIRERALKRAGVYTIAPRPETNQN